MTKSSKMTLAAFAIAFFSGPVVADSDDAGLKQLEQQIQALQARVKALEARQTFTSFMPNIAERFHVMHRAGEAGDWAVASHELEELKRITSLSPTVDKEKGQLMIGMMGSSYEALEEAIEHGDQKKFAKALNQTITTCNSCHVATGSEFVEVTLDAEESLSMRHPHRLMRREMPSGHTHGHDPATGMDGMTGPGTMNKDDHDDAGKAPHGHEKPHDDTSMPAHKHN
ncbi:MAG TPA: hypothetical protein VLS27_08095 [Gammaproteobacteria bacterium]|nr:hypothetical protein [Gammaproteobacteria bacterium]